MSRLTTGTVISRQPMPPTMPDLISLDDAAERLKLSRRTIDRYVKRGEFCALYAFPTGQLRVDAKDLDAWLLGLRKTPTRSESHHDHQAERT